MNVYLWEAGSAVGITDDEARALERAADAMLANGAERAVVVPASYNEVHKGLEAGYEPASGQRWTASRRGGTVTWTCRWAAAA